MNHAYRLVWNEASQGYVPAPEGTRARKKRGGCKAIKRLCMAVAAASLGGGYIGTVDAGPTGGEVVGGAASISQDGATTTVSQQSQNVSLNWQQFNVGANETVQFVQPSATSVALNRVIGSEASQIFGRLSANGQVFLINPNGVLFGQTAQVDVGGLVASTLNISETDFIAGRYNFASDTTVPASIVNQGAITAAAGGSVALLGGQVSNQGTIRAHLGTVALAAGRAVSLDFSGRQLLDVQVDGAELNALAQNHHLIQADGGTVIMTAAARDALLSTVVNNTGVIEARTVEYQDGVIKLLGSFDGGVVDVGGTLDASAPDAGNGGFVETSGAYVKVAETARITTLAPQGTSGTWLIDPADYTITASGGDISGATLSANLENGNVTILSTQGTVNELGNGDINVNDDVTWSAGNTLTLTALGNVNVNAAITNTGSPADGSVTLRADSAAACVAGAAASACGTVNFSGAGHITAANVNLYYNPAGSNAISDVNGIGPSYAAPTHYSANVTGALSAYMLVNDVNQLQAINTNRGGSYALGADIDASATSGWNDGAGFAPVGEMGFFTHFGGVFDGLGHSVFNLVIHRPTAEYVGLFGFASDSTIRNVHLLGGSITGRWRVGAMAGEISGGVMNNVTTSARVIGSDYVGGLLGQNSGGSVSNAYASGVVTGDYYSVGGLIGRNTYGGMVTSSRASGAVDGNGSVGGLLGENSASSTVRDSYATGAVNGVVEVGGLVGRNYDGATVSDAYATGVVTGNDNIGGLVGSNSSTVSHSSASGDVTGEVVVGGLVGFNEGAIDHASASSEVVGLEMVGGLVGENGGTIDQSSATGAVTGEWMIGGLVGNNGGTVYDAHSTGEVIGIESVGGLIGQSSGTVEAAFASGAVSGENGVGGLVGFNEGNVNEAHAAGAVSGGYGVGGLVGDNEGSVSDAYATGAVSGEEWVGGLVGQNGGDLSNVYAAGSVSGSHYVGGVMGSNDSGVVINAWYNVDEVTINGGHHVTFGGLYDGQFQDWYNGRTLDIADYAASLPFDVDTGAYLIGSVQGLRDLLAFASDGSYSFRLTSDLDLAAAPGLYIPDFRAVQFDGAGHTIANLSVDLPFVSGVGMFGYVGATSTIGNLNLASTTIAADAYVGALAGRNEGVISNVSVAASVAGTGYVGGLIGQNSGTVSGANASGSVAGEFLIGGLIGENYFPGYVTNSYATASVTGRSSVGGLLGLNSGVVEAVYAAGSVTGEDATGGLAGHNFGALRDAYATGSVTGDESTGGLVGINGGGAAIENAYATGSVSGYYSVGGLVGTNFNRVSDAYATGSVTGQLHIGGLVGRNTAFAQVTRTYATGGVTGADAATTGGLVGINTTVDVAPVSDSFWDIQTSGQSQSAGGTGRTTAEMRDADTFNAWDISAVGGSSATWRIYEGHTGPLLRSFMSGITLAIDDVNTTYNGTNQSGSIYYDAGGADTSAILRANVNFRNVGSYNLGNTLYSNQQGYDITYTGGTLDIARAALIVSSSDVVKTYDGTTTANGTAVATRGTTLFGSDNLSGGTFSFTDKNASASKTVTASGITVNDGNGGNNYDVTFIDNTTSTIERANLTLTASSDRRTYDGTTASSGNVIASGLIGGDAASATQAFASKNVMGAGGSTLQVSSYAISDSDGADMSSNYNVIAATAAGTIDAATLIVDGAVAAADKTYDASVDATVSGGVLRDVIGADAVTLLQSGSFDDKNAGVNKAVAVSFSLQGADAGNYVLANSTAHTTASVARATISNITGITAADKVYDGNTAAALDATGATFVGMFAGDQLSIDGASGVFSDRNAAADKTVSIGGFALSGTDAGNYILASNSATTTASITPKALTYTTTAASRVYDGTTAAVVTLSDLNGLVGDETLTAVGTGAFNSKDVATANTVTVTTATLADGGNGGLASNYSIAAGGTVAANITPRSLTYTTAAMDKVYDGTTAASVTLSGLQGLVGAETLGASGTGTFNAKDVATANTVTVNTATLTDGSNGGLANNYSISSGGTASAHIRPASLIITADDQIKLAGTPNPELTMNYRGFAAGESAADLINQPTPSTAADTTSRPGSYAITVSGAASSNYVFTYAPGILTVTSTAVPGHLATLAYLNDVAQEGASSDDEEKLSRNKISVLQIQGDGIRLPAGVQ